MQIQNLREQIVFFPFFLFDLLLQLDDIGLEICVFAFGLALFLAQIFVGIAQFVVRLDAARQLRDLMRQTRVFFARAPFVLFQSSVLVSQTLVFDRRFVELHAQLIDFGLQVHDLRFQPFLLAQSGHFIGINCQNRLARALQVALRRIEIGHSRSGHSRSGHSRRRVLRLILRDGEILDRARSGRQISGNRHDAAQNYERVTNVRSAKLFNGLSKNASEWHKGKAKLLPIQSFSRAVASRQLFCPIFSMKPRQNWTILRATTPPISRFVPFLLAQVLPVR